MIQILWLNPHGEPLHIGELRDWPEVFRMFRPYYRWRVRINDNGTPVLVLTSEVSGWIVEHPRGRRKR